MIQNPKILQQFEWDLSKKESLDYSQNLLIFESLWQEAVHLGILPLKNPLEGIETDMAIARILNP